MAASLLPSSTISGNPHQSLAYQPNPSLPNKTKLIKPKVWKCEVLETEQFVERLTAESLQASRKFQCSKLKLVFVNDYGRFCVLVNLKFYRQIMRSKSQIFPEVYWTGNIRFWHYISFPDSFEECMKRSLCETQIYIYPAKKIFWRYKSIGGKRTFCDNFSSHCESQEDVIHSHICTGVT